MKKGWSTLSENIRIQKTLRERDEYIEEAGAMNIFIRINDTLITGPTSDRILDGVTRKSIIDIAKSEGIKVEVRKFTVSELIEASENGNLNLKMLILN